MSFSAREGSGVFSTCGQAEMQCAHNTLVSAPVRALGSFLLEMYSKLVRSLVIGFSAREGSGVFSTRVRVVPRVLAVRTRFSAREGSGVFSTRHTCANTAADSPAAFQRP